MGPANLANLNCFVLELCQSGLLRRTGGRCGGINQTIELNNFNNLLEPTVRRDTPTTGHTSAEKVQNMFCVLQSWLGQALPSSPRTSKTRGKFVY